MSDTSAPAAVDAIHAANLVTAMGFPITERQLGELTRDGVGPEAIVSVNRPVFYSEAGLLRWVRFLNSKVQEAMATPMT